MKQKIKYPKGQKKKIARELRKYTGMPARKICRTMKTSNSIYELAKYTNITFEINHTVSNDPNYEKTIKLLHERPAERRD